jgi:hypothetical protein
MDYTYISEISAIVVHEQACLDNIRMNRKIMKRRNYSRMGGPVSFTGSDFPIVFTLVTGASA